MKHSYFSQYQTVHALDRICRSVCLVIVICFLVGGYDSQSNSIQASNAVSIDVQQDPTDAGGTFDEDGWYNLAFPGIEGSVGGMKTIDGDLYVWGVKKIGGIEVDSLARLDDETGMWSSIRLEASPRIYDLALHNNQLYVAGNINLEGVNHGVAIYEAGVWTPLGGEFNGWVWDIEWHQGMLYAIGEFTDIGGVMANRIARWNGSAWEPLGSGILGFGPIVRVVALAGVGDTLYVGGKFDLAGGVQVKNLAAWQNNQWRKSIDFNGEVRLLATDGTSLYVDRQQGGLVRIQDEQLFPVGVGLPPGVLVGAMLPAHGGIYVAADTYFRATNADGSTTPLSNVAFFDGVNWHSMGEDFIRSDRPSPPFRLTLWRNQLVAAGFFDRSGAKALPGLAMWDGVQWNPPPLNPGTPFGVDDAVLAMTVYGDALYAVGRFKFAGQVSVPGVARWDGQNWHAVGDGTLGGLTAADFVAVDGRGVFIAGQHRLEDGIELWNVAFWNGMAWQLIGDALRGRITSLAVDGSILYVSGSFRPFDSENRYDIGQWNGAQWTFYGNNLFDWKGIAKMAVINNTVYGCGESYSEQAGISSPVLARWNGNGWLSVFPEGLYPKCELTVHDGSFYLTAEFIGRDANGFPYHNPALLRVVGDQWEVISKDPLQVGAPYVLTDAGELFAHSDSTLPSQFADATWPAPIARIHWVPVGSSRALPVPRSDFGIGPTLNAVYYRGMVVIGGIFLYPFTGEKTYMEAWRPLSADVVLGLEAPQKAQLGQRIPITGSVTLAGGKGAPYVMAVLDDRSSLLNTEIESLDSCKKLVNNSDPFNPWRNQGMECAWRRLREGERRDYRFSVLPSQLGLLSVEMHSHWSGNELDRLNDSAKVWIDVYDTWTTTPTGGRKLFLFGEEVEVELVAPAGAVASTVDLRLEAGAAIAPSTDSGLAMIQPMFELNLDSTQRQGDLTFAQPISANVGYTKTDAYRVIESTLSLHRYDDTLQSWVPTHSECAGDTANASSQGINKVTGPVCRTGTYALLGEATPILYLPLTQKAPPR